MSIELTLCDVKIFQLKSMSNAVRCIKRFAFKNSRISGMALIFNLNIPRTTVLYAKKLVAGGEIRRVRFFHYWIFDIIPFFSSNGYEPMA